MITKDLLARRVLSQVQKLRTLGLSVGDVLADYRALEKRLDKFIKYCVRKHWLRDGRDGKLLLNKEAAPYAGTLQVIVDNGEFSLGSKAAGLVWVISRSDP